MGASSDASSEGASDADSAVSLAVAAVSSVESLELQPARARAATVMTAAPNLKLRFNVSPSYMVPAFSDTRFIWCLKKTGL
jgi:isocitrate lyase